MDLSELFEKILKDFNKEIFDQIKRENNEKRNLKIEKGIEK